MVQRVDLRPKILIVDDRVENLYALEVVLSPLEVDLIRASSGNKALALTLEHDFALALIDVQMPGMDGYETVDLMRQSKATEHLHILFVSAIFSGAIHKIRGVEVGAVDFIEKPIVPEILLGKVRIFLQLHHQKTLLRAANEELEINVRRRTAELQQANEDLRRSEERFRRLFQDSPAALVLTDQNGVILIRNLKFEQLFGYTIADAPTLANWWPKACPNPDYRTQLQQIWGTSVERATMTAQAVEAGEFCLYNQDGQELNVQIVINVLTDGVLASFHDVTERKKAEDALFQRSYELEQRNEELQRFNYTVSHDLKTPLVTIKTFLGFLETDLNGQLTAQVATDLNYIGTAADGMAMLLEDLQRLSRIGKSSSPKVDTTFHAVVQEVLQLMAGPIALRNVVIEVEREDVCLHGDRVYLLQLWQNLIENAVKFMGDQSQPRIHIGIMPDSDMETVFYVRDNGSGIDPRHADTIFGLFNKLNRSSTGSGIGLALVKRIVELHGGRIWMESSGVGLGSCFLFTLPAVRPQRVQCSHRAES